MRGVRKHSCNCLFARRASTCISRACAAQLRVRRHDARARQGRRVRARLTVGTGRHDWDKNVTLPAEATISFVSLWVSVSTVLNAGWTQRRRSHQTWPCEVDAPNARLRRVRGGLLEGHNVAQEENVVFPGEVGHRPLHGAP